MFPRKMVLRTWLLTLALAFFFIMSTAALSFAQPAPPAAAGPRNTGLLAPLSRGETLDLPALDDRLPRPEAFLGYPLGSRFTSWDRIVAYLETLDAASPRVTMWEYGRTYEGRPLKLLAVSAPENLERLEEIRKDSLRLADPAAASADERERTLRRTPLVVWLAYGVHGNESSSAEAALGAAYVLAAAQGETAEMLKDVVVLIDPLQNPDGRERYVNGYGQRRGDEANTRRAAAEHWEPWPGGRQNHYLIDLNRDWAWASQQETRQRIAAYRAWEPQVYVDFHEMGTENSYFFPPSAEPINPRIDRRVISWLDIFGRANAAAFDRQGWVYFKEENYDLFYPGYGDSYPSLRGAVGMTYEMAGGGRAGVALALPDGTVLTLADRVARHLTTSLATVRTAARNSRKLLADFAANRARSVVEPARTFLWPADQPEARSLADLLALHGVRVRQLAQGSEIPVRPLAKGAAGEAQPHRFAAGTYAVSTAQPLGNLVQALLEIDSPMNQAFLDRQRKRLEQNLDAEFYDITAWSLPLAYNLRTWVAVGDVAADARPLGEASGGIEGEGDLGWLVPPQGIASYRLAAALQNRKVHFRVALAPFTVGGSGGGGASYPAGTLFVPSRANGGGVRGTLQSLLQETVLKAQALSSSYELKGLSLGSNDMPAVRPVRVGLLSGEGVDATSFGFLWYLLDRQIGVNHDRLDLAQLRQIPLHDFDVLVLPDGSYDDQISDKLKTSLDGWIKDGGVLVAIGDAVTWLQDKELTSIKRWQAPKKDDKADSQPDDPESSESPADKQLAQRPIFTPGAVLVTRMQPQHPLTLGLPSSPNVLYEGTNVLKATGDPRQDALTVADESPVAAGFAWPEAVQRLSGSLLVGSEQRGKGSVVVFVQDPDYRLFWRATMPIFLNAVLFGPSTGLGSGF
ncbi:MAG TPA: M14 metallopeptidase family protein [Thermoanaerobaculia bacterium]|nr:M14 metallopeptidase family protein [Thermoanaerobaculia bacterium]